MQTRGGQLIWLWGNFNNSGLLQAGGPYRSDHRHKSSKNG